MSEFEKFKNQAFCKYLRSIPRSEAKAHLWECLSNGPSSNNMAWELADFVGLDFDHENATKNKLLEKMMSAIELNPSAPS